MSTAADPKPAKSPAAASSTHVAQTVAPRAADKPSRKTKRMLPTVLLVLAALAAVFIVVVATRPAEFRVSRSATIPAPSPEVFAQVNDLHNWEAWSPWARLDPQAKGTYDGPREGVDASFAWSGNSEVGEGRMTITGSRPHELVQLRLEFLKPFKATNTAEFTFEPDGEQTLVTWTMSGTNNFMSKAVGLFMDCETMVGGQFEQGLANLKSVVETAPAN